MAQDTIHKIIEITIKNSDLIEKDARIAECDWCASTETKQLKQDLEEYGKSLKEGKITQEQFDRMMVRRRMRSSRTTRPSQNSSRTFGNIRGKCSRISGRTPQRPDR